MLNILEGVIVTALTSSFLILLIAKTGIRNKVIEKAPRLISELFSCDFCLSFWTSLMASIVLFYPTGLYGIILCAICSTPICRILL